MRILFVAPTLPVPTSGGRTRLFNLVKQLAQTHEVSVISFMQPGEEEMLSLVEPFCHRLVTVPSPRFKPMSKWRNRLFGWSRILFDRRPLYAQVFPVAALRDPLRQLLLSETFDVAVLQALYVVELTDDLCGLPVVLTEENVESEVARRAYQQAAQPLHRLRDWLVWRKLLAFERSWVRRFPVCVAVSERDAGLLRAMSPASRVYVVPNGVDSAYFAPPSGERAPARLLFFGVLSYGPNVQGLTWFCQEVFPRLRALRPEVKLEICGPQETPPVTELGHQPGVTVTGFVPDIRPKLWQATANVVPLHVGGGTRLKILEALAAGCPVVSTAVGAEGLDLVGGQDILIADGAEAFARELQHLLDSPELCHRLAQAGRQAVTQRYDWRRIAPTLETACLHAVDLGTTGRNRVVRSRGRSVC